MVDYMDTCPVLTISSDFTWDLTSLNDSCHQHTSPTEWIHDLDGDREINDSDARSIMDRRLHEGSCTA